MIPEMIERDLVYDDMKSMNVFPVIKWGADATDGRMLQSLESVISRCSLPYRA